VEYLCDGCHKWPCQCDPEFPGHEKEK
jgi:hypothetical protein